LLKSFSEIFQEFLFESLVHSFIADPHGSIKSGQMLFVNNKFGTILRTPGENTPIVKVFLHSGKYINYILQDFQTKLDTKEIQFIK